MVTKWRSMARARTSICMAVVLSSASLTVWGAEEAPASATAVAPPGDTELLETIIAHNTAAREKIKSFIVKVESERTWDFDPAEVPTPTPVPIPKGMRTDYTKATLIKDGPYIRVDSEFVIEVKEKGYRDETSVSCCLNDAYYAEVPRGIKNWMYVYEHRSIAEMSDKAKFRMSGYFVPNVMYFGFGTGSFYLNNEYAKRTSKRTSRVHWGVSTDCSDGNLKYKVVQTLPSMYEGKLRRNEFVIDPERDFLIEESTSWDEHGIMREHMRASFQEVPGDIWFPKDIHLRYVEDKAFETHIRVLSAQVNVSIGANHFVLDNLRFDRNTLTIRRFTPDGTYADFVHYGGQWIPENAAPPGFRPEPRPVIVK